MGLFAVSYTDVPGQALIAQGGMKFRRDERSLRSYFAPILDVVNFDDLIGEAVFYVRMPEVMGALAFPLALLAVSGQSAAVLTVCLVSILKLLQRVVYIKPLNYLSFWLGSPVVWGIYYVAIAFVTDASVAWLAVGWLFLLIATPIIDVFLDLLFLKRVYTLPLSDQVLRIVGWHHGTKAGVDPATWIMNAHL